MRQRCSHRRLGFITPICLLGFISKHKMFLLTFWAERSTSELFCSKFGSVGRFWSQICIGNELGCRGMCRLVTWLYNYFSPKKQAVVSPSLCYELINHLWVPGWSDHKIYTHASFQVKNLSQIWSPLCNIYVAILRSYNALTFLNI